MTHIFETNIGLNVWLFEIDYLTCMQFSRNI